MANRLDLRRLHRAIKLVAEIDPFMTITRLETFLAFASDKGINSVQDLREYLALTDISSSAVSRNVSYWMDQQWLRPDGTRPDGEKFIRSYPDPMDHRRKMMQLTPRGHHFCDKLYEATYGLPEPEQHVHD